MIEEIMDSYRKMYKKNLISTKAQEKKTIDYDEDTEFILSQVTPEQSFINYNVRGIYNSKSVPKLNGQTQKLFHKHEKCSSCIKCHPYFRMLKKQKNKLINYINNSKPNHIKLIGNDRYSKATPEKYVYDNISEIPGRKMGLIPLPINKRNRKLDQIDLYKYYELQRSIVMMRRIQYDRKI